MSVPERPRSEGGDGGHGPQDLAAALAAATARLAAAGVPSPRADAEALAAHLLGTSRGAVAAAALRGAPAPAGLDDLVARRARREPLQHLTGRAAFRRVEVAVGPGVFVPRPETEVTAGLAIAAAAAVAARGPAGRAPVVVDLCTGSGAIALAVADEVPGARVHAVESQPAAHAWAARNTRGSGVALHLADAATAAAPGGPLADLAGGVDVVVANPPYVPPGAVPREPEVRDHDPAPALWGGGPDGLDVPRAVVATAAALLRPGGVVAVEHAEVQQDAVLVLLAGPAWQQARGHPDLAGRPRCCTAVRTPQTPSR